MRAPQTRGPGQKAPTESDSPPSSSPPSGAPPSGVLRVAPLQPAGRGKTMRVTLTDVGERIVACERCPRLRSYCARVAQEKRRAYRDEVYWGKPVPGFGDPRARLLLVGLAPAA